MKNDQIDSLKFYIDALLAHRNAKKQDKDFSEKLKSLYLLDQIDGEVYEIMHKVIYGAKATNKKVEVPQTSQVSSGGCGGPPAASNGRCGGSAPARTTSTGSCGNHREPSANGRC